MNQKELEKIKEKALDEHIPIIMDDTLEVVDKILKEVKPKRRGRPPKKKVEEELAKTEENKPKRRGRKPKTTQA